MTRQGAPTPPSPSPNEVEYVRKLALAILSTLQSKGLLSPDEVDAILIAARRAAQGQPEKGQPAPQPAMQTPASAPRITAQPSPPPGTLSWSVTAPPARELSPQKSNAEASAKEETQPPVIDIKLD